MFFYMLVVIVDGFSGVGKGILCMLLVKKFGFQLLDFGVIYCVLVLVVFYYGVDFELEDVLVFFVMYFDVQFIVEGDLVKVIFEGEDVFCELCKEEIGMVVLKVVVLFWVCEVLLCC